MRVKIYASQSTVICNTLNRSDPAIVIIKALEATVVFIDQERSNLDGNIDAAGNPGGGTPIVNTDPPLVLSGAKLMMWGRAAVDTFVDVQVIEQRFEVTNSSRVSTHQPGSQARPRSAGALPPVSNYLRRPY